MSLTAWRVATLAAALAILWRIITVNAVLFDERGRPRLFTAPRTPIEAPQERQALVGILERNPAEVSALVMLALELERGGDVARAARAFEVAGAVAPIDRDVLRASASFYLRHGRNAEAATRLGLLAEHFSDFEASFPALTHLLVAGDPAWKSLATRNPTWLGRFVTNGCAQQFDAALLAPLLQKRIDSGRAQATEVDCVTRKLRTAGAWEAAYQVWLNSLGRERLRDVGHIFNGGFELAPGVGFDWEPAQGSDRVTGHSVDFAAGGAGGAGKRALRVVYNGRRQAAPAIQQYLVVTPGRYELSGMARLESLNSVRGLQWSVRCASRPGASMLGASERFLGSGEWRRFAFEVTVPAECAGQVLRLEPAGFGEGTVFLAGTAWFDELRLERRR